MFSLGCAVRLPPFPLLLRSVAAGRLSEGTRCCPAFFRLSGLGSLGSARRRRHNSKSGAASGRGRCRLDTEGPLDTTSPRPSEGFGAVRYGFLLYRPRERRVKTPSLLPPFPGWVTLPGLGTGEPREGCQSRRHPPNNQPSIPRQSQQDRRLAARGSGALRFEAMPALAPWPL